MYKVYADELGYRVPIRGLAIVGDGFKWRVEGDDGVVWRLTKRQARYINALKRKVTGKVEVLITENMVRLTLEDGAKIVLWRDGGVSGDLEEELRPKSWWARFLRH